MDNQTWEEAWWGGCPDCGEDGAILSTEAVRGQPVRIELECPFCGRVDREPNSPIAEKTFSKVVPWSSPTVRR